MNETLATTRRRIAAAAAALGVCFVTAPSATWADEATADTGSESLGSDLLRDLDPELFIAPPAAPAAEPARPDFQKRILPGVVDEWLGEDVGPSSPGKALAWVERNMQTAARLLPDERSLPRAGQLQQQIVRDLDQLIDELAQQCRGGASTSSGQPSTASRRSPTAPKSGAAKPGGGQSAARESTSQLRRGDGRAAGPRDREDLMKNLWGHLPPRAREQMLQSYSEEFLPQYELEIEKYFRRLADEPGDQRND